MNTLLPHVVFTLLANPQAGKIDAHGEMLENITRRYSAYAQAVLRHDIYAVMNYMTSDVVWVERKGKDTTYVDRVEIVKRLQPWIESMDPKGVLRFHINKMAIRSDDEVDTEIEVQYAPKGEHFPPKLKDSEKNIWREKLVKISERWMLKRAEQISPKSPQ